mmetsp:Transcript_14255/g.62047  ORF Transcript_14255/g.62047 Transcript_14255/m.62047 type:complete len:130 (-) Transcript_14255:1695-2084(-)
MLPPGLQGLTEMEVEKLLIDLDEFTPTIPDALTNHYLKISGIREPDIRATRLVSLAAQRFISQVSADARACAQQRFEMQAKDKRERGLDPRDRRVVLTIDDLHAALNDYGLDLRKPEYFAGGVTDGSRG